MSAPDAIALDLGKVGTFESISAISQHLGLDYGLTNRLVHQAERYGWLECRPVGRRVEVVPKLVVQSGHRLAADDVIG